MESNGCTRLQVLSSDKMFTLIWKFKAEVSSYVHKMTDCPSLYELMLCDAFLRKVSNLSQISMGHNRMSVLYYCDLPRLIAIILLDK
jgi:hypothetical protein